MKKIAAIIITLTALVNLTACGKILTEDNNSLSDGGASAENIQQDPDSGQESPGDEASVDDGVRALIDAFALEEFTAPDGSVLKRSDAVKAESTGTMTFAVGYDFAFVRYAQPVWWSSADDPDHIDWDTLENAGDSLEYPENAQYFRVKEGDTLENGLTVKKAEYFYAIDESTFVNTVEFDGELTLEGILYYVPKDTEYVVGKDDVFFFADPARCDTIPVPILNAPLLESWTDTDCKFSVNYDGKRIQAGTLNDLPDSVEELLKEQNGVRVKAALRNIRSIQAMYGPAMFAEIVSAERVSE